MHLSIHLPSYLYNFMYLKINNRPAAACTYDVHACMHACTRAWYQRARAPAYSMSE